MSCLYVTENGALISAQQHRLEVKYQNGDERSIPIETLESIEIFGKSQMTSQAINECLKRNIYVSYHSRGGCFIGSLIPAGNSNASRQRKQFQSSECEMFCLEIAKSIIKAKIHNQTVLLRRYARNGSDNANDEIYIMLRTEARIDRCGNVEEIMGCEGYAARQYFKGLGRLVNEEFSFERRTKRPPKDEFNALLSLGYSILFHEIYAKIEKKGLNSYLGFLHQDKIQHPALASDLIEEWRAVLVDSVVMSLVNGKEIKKEHFETGEGEIWLNKEGMKIFISKLEKKMRTEMRYINYVDYPVSFRQGIDLQINQLVKAIENNTPQLYQPVRIR